jgi:hypothetical protein
MFKYLLLFFLVSFSANSATSGNLVLTGIIPKKVEITVTPKASASTLDLETTQTNLSVATLTGKSNALLGYKISVSSANLGKLVHTSSPTNFVNYTLKIDSSSVNLATGGFVNYTGLAPFTKDVNISYTGVDGFSYSEGNYTDTITFTISGN